MFSGESEFYGGVFEKRPGFYSRLYEAAIMSSKEVSTPIVEVLNTIKGSNARIFFNATADTVTSKEVKAGSKFLM